MPNRKVPREEGTPAGDGQVPDRENASAESEYTVEESHDRLTDLDPQLQKMILRHRAGEPLNPEFVQEADDGSLQIDVLAVVKDPSLPVPGLNVARVIGDVVTGTADLDRIEEVRRDPNVISLKGARGVTPMLEFSVPEIRGDPESLQQSLPGSNVDGRGVIVGVVDFGCDFVHENFRRPDGKTRLLFLWDQSRPQNSMSPAGFPYGREFTAAQINAALAGASPYQALAYHPGLQAHGTHVMDIAAGNGRGSGKAGVAPGADLIFVQLATEGLSASESFGNSRRLLEAVDYIFDKAAQLGRQAVVNLSLGTHGGPHDGSTPAERGFDNLLQAPGRTIVISAGNSFQRRSHASGRLEAGQSRVVGWEKFADDTTTNECEVWYDRQGDLAVTLVFPGGGTRVGPVAAGTTSVIKRNGVEVGRIIHRRGDPLNGDNQIDILLDPSLPSGVWGVELRAAAPATYHAWIERDDDAHGPVGQTIRNQSKFVAGDNDPTCTVGSISCGRHTLAVGSYSAVVQQRDLSAFTSQGPTRDGKQKPEVSAPGDGVMAAASTTRTGTVRMSGTSMAAPHVTGLVALLMQAAGRPLSVAEIRKAVIDTARSSPPAGGGWDPRYGHGRCDAAACMLVHAAPLPVAGAILAPAQANGDGPSPAGLDALLSSLSGAVGRSKVRVRLEVEIEP